MIAYHHRRARHRLWLRTRADRRLACCTLLDAMEAHSRVAVLRFKHTAPAIVPVSSPSLVPEAIDSL
jgi:hypothetical protein